MSDLSPSDEAALHRAQELLEAHRPAEAAGLASEILSHAPDAARAVAVLALASSSLGNHREALDHALRMTELDPHGDETDRTLIQVLVPAGHAREADEIAERLVVRSPHSWDAHLLLAYARVNGPRPDTRRAVEAARAAVALAPGEPATHSYLGWCLARHGRVVEARTAYEAALALDPTHAPALNNLGVLHLDRADLQQAGAAIGSGLQLTPASPVLRRNMNEVVVRALGRLAATAYLFAVLTGLVALAYDLAYGNRLAIGVVLAVLSMVQLRRVRRSAPLSIADWARAALHRRDRVALTVLLGLLLSVLCLALVTVAPDPLVLPTVIVLWGTGAVGTVFAVMFRLRLIRTS